MNNQMDNNELILEIIEKVHEQVQKLDNKVDVLTIEQVRQGEMHRINTANLEKHMARTELLEKRIAFYDSVSIIIAALAAIVLFAIKVWPILSHLL